MTSAFTRLSRLLAVVAPMGLTVGAACDGGKGARDASAAAQKSAEISVRFEGPNGAAPSVSVLAFRATASGGAEGVADVLSIVDPLVAPAPEAGCQLRDVAGAARAVSATGGRVDLSHLGGLNLDLGLGAPMVRPTPRVYPDLAAVVGGVVGEAGPIDINAAPEAIVLTDGAGARETVSLPGQPKLLAGDGSNLPASAAIPVGSDFTLGVTGAPFIELRPFGATLALACAVGPNGKVVVTAGDLTRLSQASGHVPVSVEAVVRDTRLVNLAGGPARLSLEVRASTVVELRP